MCTHCVEWARCKFLFYARDWAIIMPSLPRDVDDKTRPTKHWEPDQLGIYGTPTFWQSEL